MYRWRKLTPEQRAEELALRQLQNRPWHSPPHIETKGARYYLFTGTCLNHHCVIASRIERLSEFSNVLLSTIVTAQGKCISWVVLPNHYHALAEVVSCKAMLRELGRMHGRTSRAWNLQDDQTGRQIWHNAIETVIKSDSHYWATINYVHHNPVRHGLVANWQEWPWSSARQFLTDMGRETTTRLWQQYPVDAYGDGWDDEMFDPKTQNAGRTDEQALIQPEGCTPTKTAPHEASSVGVQALACLPAAPIQPEGCTPTQTAAHDASLVGVQALACLSESNNGATAQ